MLVVAEREQLPVSQARAGEPAAWDALFRRYQLPLYVYVFELVHDEQTSLDLVQETFIAAVRHIGSLRDDEKFGSWLFGIAHQKCIQRWRKQNREEMSARGNSPMRRTNLKTARTTCSSGGTGSRIYESAESIAVAATLGVAAALRRGLFARRNRAALPETQPGTVKSRLHYAKKSLRKLLEEKK